MTTNPTPPTGSPPGVALGLTDAELSEAGFYRRLLEQICEDPRKTRAKRLAQSGLIFWDQMKKERATPDGKDAL